MVRTPYLAALAVAFSTLAFVAPARAGIDACGNIDVDADASCTVEVDNPCMVQCTPVSFELSCASQLEVSCEPMCSHLPTIDCTGSCTGDCMTECNADPGSFDCQGSCTADCQGTCQGKCASSADQTNCEASCKATCTASCQGSCTGTPPHADCSTACQAQCQGKCTADANIDCQANCQANGFASCQSSLTGGCQAACMDPKGALFCDGQFVDVGGNLQSCITALDDYLKSQVHISASASGSSDCAVNTCEAQGKAAVSCHCSTPSRSDASGLAPLTVATIAGLGMLARRRKRPR